METPANQPPRLKLAAPSGAAAAVGGEGPEWDWAAPWERPGAPPRSTGSRPQRQRQQRAGRAASGRSGAPGLAGKSCGPAASALVGQACSSRSHGVRGAWGDTPLPPPPEESRPGFSRGCWSSVARASSQPLLLGPHGGVGW